MREICHSDRALTRGEIRWVIEGASERCPCVEVRIHRFLGNLQDFHEIKDSVEMRPVIEH